MSNVIEYSFRGELDIDLLAKNMRKDKTPIVVVIMSIYPKTAIYILKEFRENYKGKDMPLTEFMFSLISQESCFDHPFLSRWSFEKKIVSEVLSNIKAIIKSHEDACLPVVKVLAVETTADWSK